MIDDGTSRYGTGGQHSPAAATPQAARALAYRLFAICERKGWAEEALAASATGWW